MAGTLILAIVIDEASAIVRSGPPVDDARDLEWSSEPAKFPCIWWGLSLKSRHT